MSTNPVCLFKKRKGTVKTAPFRLLTKSILFLNPSLKLNDSRAEKAYLVNKSCELLSAQGRALGEQKIFRQVVLSHTLAKNRRPRPNLFLT